MLQQTYAGLREEYTGLGPPVWELNLAESDAELREFLTTFQAQMSNTEKGKTALADK